MRDQPTTSSRTRRTTASRREDFDAVNVSVQARLENGLTFQAGVGPGRLVTNDCEVVDDLPEMLQATAGNPSRSFAAAARPLERCEQNNGWRTGVSGLASYTDPEDRRAGQRHVPEPAGHRRWTRTTTRRSPATNLGRPFTGATFRNYNIVPAGEVYIERLNQIDFRVAKIFRFGGTRTAINFDFFNITNSNSVLTENATFVRGAEHRLENAAVDPAAAPVQDQRAVRLLDRKARSNAMRSSR